MYSHSKVVADFTVSWQVETVSRPGVGQRLPRGLLYAFSLSSAP